MVNIAFPAMAATFAVAAPAMRWVIVCYVLSYAFLSFAGGALGDRIGYRPVFVVGLAAALRGLPRESAGASRGPVRPRDVLRRSVLHLGALPFLAFGGNFAIWLLAPFYIVDRRGLDPMVGGLMFMLTPLGMTLGAPLAARLAERLGARVTVVAGLLVEALGLGALGTAGATTPFAAVAAELFAAGL